MTQRIFLVLNDTRSEKYMSLLHSIILYTEQNILTVNSRIIAL